MHSDSIFIYNQYYIIFWRVANEIVSNAAVQCTAYVNAHSHTHTKNRIESFCIQNEFWMNENNKMLTMSTFTDSGFGWTVQISEVIALASVMWQWKSISIDIKTQQINIHEQEQWSC